jgi:hypothetical protein
MLYALNIEEVSAKRLPEVENRILLETGGGNRYITSAIAEIKAQTQFYDETYSFEFVGDIHADNKFDMLDSIDQFSSKNQDVLAKFVKESECSIEDLYSSLKNEMESYLSQHELDFDFVLDELLLGRGIQKIVREDMEYGEFEFHDLPKIGTKAVIEIQYEGKSHYLDFDTETVNENRYVHIPYETTFLFSHHTLYQALEKNYGAGMAHYIVTRIPSFEEKIGQVDY